MNAILQLRHPEVGAGQSYPEGKICLSFSFHYYALRCLSLKLPMLLFMFSCFMFFVQQNSYKRTAAHDG